MSGKGVEEKVGKRSVYGQDSLASLPTNLARLFLAQDRKSELCTLVHF